MKLPATWTLGDQTFELRPIRYDDGELWLELMRTMSWATRYKRGARPVEALSPEDVRRAVEPDGQREIALVAVASHDGARSMVGVARATRSAGDTWEFGLVVLDEWQRRGVGGRLMAALIDALGDAGATAIEGEVLASNKSMLEFVGRMGFEMRPRRDAPEVKHVWRTVSREQKPDQRSQPEGESPRPPACS